MKFRENPIIGMNLERVTRRHPHTQSLLSSHKKGNCTKINDIY
jgi:hypothetical protein